MSTIARDISKGIVYTRNADLPTIFAPVLSVTAGTIDSSTNYTQYDLLHTGLLVFDGVFISSSDSVIQIDSIVIKEYGTTLKKFDCKLVLFADYGDLDSTNIVKNAVFNFTAGFTDTNINQIINVTSADFLSFVTNGSNTYNARVQKAVSDNIKIQQYNNDRNLYGFLQYTGSGADKYVSGATLEIGIGIKTV